MIYEFQVSTNKKVKTMLLSADSKSAFFRRIAEMYGLTKEEILLTREYEETPDFGYKLHKSYVKEVSKSTKKTAKKANDPIITKALQAFKDGDDRSKRMVEPRKSDYIQRHKMKWCPINSAEDVAELMHKYKTVKVYWENGEKRGTHAKYCVYK